MTDKEVTYRIMDIVEGTSVDGPGLRTSVYFAGCNHHCPDCHNPQTWPMDAGRDISLKELLYVIEKADFNVTLSGGDPVFQAHKLKPLIAGIRDLGKSVWLYTGYTFDELLQIPHVKDWIEMVEAVVDGPFINNLRDISLPFRGSSNQRIIYLNNL